MSQLPSPLLVRVSSTISSAFPNRYLEKNLNFLNFNGDPDLAHRGPPYFMPEERTFLKSSCKTGEFNSEKDETQFSANLSLNIFLQTCKTFESFRKNLVFKCWLMKIRI